MTHPIVATAKALRAKFQEAPDSSSKRSGLRCIKNAISKAGRDSDEARRLVEHARSYLSTALREEELAERRHRW